MYRICCLHLLVVVTSLGAQSPTPPSQLRDYVAKVDDACNWKIESVINESGNTIARIHLTSQKWQGELWEHDVQIILPKDVKPTATVLLYNTGGKASPTMSAIGLALAQKTQSPVVFLFGIPKQPLYGKREDALIAESFIKFLETKDATWPLLFPMVKSVVRCMDAVQAYAKQEWKTEVTGFIITGASKRGWTSWLTAATGDKRVKAIAPMVFDSLNMREQMPHQLKSFGRYSLMIKDYQDRNLLPLPDTSEARLLWAMVDPWVYREMLTMPKLIINGTNDPYWTQDALNLYWNDLKGPKNLIYVPNAGHDLRAMEDPSAARPVKEIFPMRMVDTLAAFSRAIIAKESIPTIEVTFPESAAPAGTIEAKFSTVPKTCRVWHATSQSRDFRKSKWTAGGDQTAADKLLRIEQRCTQPFDAFFIEAEFESDGKKYHLSTPIRIVEQK